MKNIHYLTLAALSLAGCETNSDQRTPWERDCQRNYSENSREFAACKARMEKLKSNPTAQNSAQGQNTNTVGVDPENANLPTTDETRKSHDVGN